MKTKTNQTNRVDHFAINSAGLLATYRIHSGKIKSRNLNYVSKASRNRIEDLLNNSDYAQIHFIMSDGLNVAITRRYDWEIK